MVEIQTVRLSRLQTGADKRSPHPFLVVGNDAADEVGLCVVQRGHQFAQRFFVELSHRTEHALLGFGGAGSRTLRHFGDGIQTYHSVH